MPPHADSSETIVVRSRTRNADLSRIKRILRDWRERPIVVHTYNAILSTVGLHGSIDRAVDKRGDTVYVVSLTGDGRAGFYLKDITKIIRHADRIEISLNYKDTTSIP
jgi:hypothetical protein